MCSKVLSSIAFVAFTFFVIVDGDSRMPWDACHYFPHEVKVELKPWRYGYDHVKFFVPPRRWGFSENDVPLTLGVEWRDVQQQNALRKAMYILEPQRGAPAATKFPSTTTRLPHKDLRLGWNTLRLTWNITYGKSSTLNIGDIQTEVNIGPSEKVNITVDGMKSFLNCKYMGGGYRGYRFKSYPLWRKRIIPFEWGHYGNPHIAVKQPYRLSFSTYPGGRNVTFCLKTNETQDSLNWYLRRECPPPIWREHGGKEDGWQIYISGRDIHLEEEEDYLVVDDKYKFMELEVKYTGEEHKDAWTYTKNQTSVYVIYEDVFPPEEVKTTTAVPITTPTAECPVCSLVTPSCPQGSIFNYTLLFHRLKEREEQLWAARRHIEQLTSGYINNEDLCTTASEQALDNVNYRTTSPFVPVVTEDQQPRTSTVYNASTPADEDLTAVVTEDQQSRTSTVYYESTPADEDLTTVTRDPLYDEVEETTP